MVRAIVERWDWKQAAVWHDSDRLEGKTAGEPTDHIHRALVRLRMGVLQYGYVSVLKQAMCA